MDPLLSSVPESLLHFVEDQLSNNDICSDAGLLDDFIRSGLTEEAARQALAYRDLYLAHVYLLGFTSIRKAAQALRFNPHTLQFEPV